ncbi:hypothetical protein SAMN05880501_101705 [Ureibacillus xyleni]|uniref:Uncharacterized protein n=1 Tax=Ureibacillus xyleni TaxID=614648 RepID=A0A285RI79_9BACL|nr:hypothetical protein [Ureibacillus xyleni]SOB93813.1 hypothetical protein SAMN05880501_101705 [Ureibacillus xyleni]
MLVMMLLVVPTIGVLWFLNFTTFLKHLNNGKSTHNQNVLGATLTFIFLFALMYCLAGTH